MSCKQAIGIAEQMKEIFGDELNLSIFTLDSMEALQYNFRSSTNVLLNEELVPLDTALDKEKMKDFLTSQIGAAS